MSEPAARPQHPSDAGAAIDERGRRQERIRERVVADGFVRIADLAAELDVSLMTIHRDLDVLESQGWLRKVRGGATARPSALYHGDIRHRMQTAQAEKAALAKAALRLISPGDVVILDDSTTTLQLAHLLPAAAPLTVITNLLSSMKALAGQTGIDLVGLGGNYYPAYDSFLGIQTVESVRELRADTLFMSTTAITRGSCFHQSQETIQVKRALMEAAERRVLLVDHSKFERHAVHALTALDAFDLVLLDSLTPDGVVEELRAGGIRVTIAPVGASTAAGA